MSNYYDKRDAAVIIAEALMARGWKIYGYKPNESEMMYDYYSPAEWSGIAEKNGWVLVVSNQSSIKENQVEDWRSSTRSTTATSQIDYEKIEKLSKMTVENGCTQAEADNAKAQIEKMREKANKSKKEDQTGIVYYPAHEANPKGSGWHIEKDGEIYEKGRSIMTMYSTNLFYHIDHSTLKPTAALNQDDEKALKNLIAFIEKVEKIAAVKVGEGEEEEKLEKVIQTVEKTIKKLEEIENPEGMKIGDVFYNNSTLYQVIEMDEKIITVNKLGSQKGGYKLSKAANAIDRWVRGGARGLETAVQNGKQKIYQIVEETITEEKIEYKKPVSNKKQAKPTTEEKTEETPTHSNTQQHTEEKPEEKPEEKQGLEKVIEEVAKIEDETIKKELIGEWLWISGDTWKHKETLKKLGFRWASKKKMWYYREEKQIKWRSKKEYTIEEIKDRYTTKNI